MEHCWHKLRLRNTQNAIREDWVFPTVTGDYGIWKILATDMLTPEWINYLQTIGINIESLMLFYRGQNIKNNDAHVDISMPYTPTIKYVAGGLNFVLQGNGSSMIWYETPKEYKELQFTKANTPYLSWLISDLVETDRAEIGNELVLVRTNVPHSIIMGNEPRWCISVRPINAGSISWEYLVNHFRSLNALVER
jgi:hypothetical protein